MHLAVTLQLGWFTVDFVGSIPWEIFQLIANGGLRIVSTDEASAGTSESLRTLNQIKILKIPKLLRLGRLFKVHCLTPAHLRPLPTSTLVPPCRTSPRPSPSPSPPLPPPLPPSPPIRRPWPSRLPPSASQVLLSRLSGAANIGRIGVLVFVLLLLVHWLTCIWFIIVVSSEDGWLATVTLGDGSPLPLGNTPEELMVRYFFMYHSTLLIMMGEQSNPVRTGEIIFVSITIVVGSCVNAIIFANVASLVAQLGDHAARHAKRMESVNSAMRVLKTSPRIQKRVKSYFEYLHARHHNHEGEAFIRSLPYPLRLRIGYMLFEGMLRQYDLFDRSDPRIVAGIATVLVAEVFLPPQLIITAGAVRTCMYFIASGKVQLIRLRIMKGHDGKTSTTTVSNPQHYFAELSLFSDAVYDFSVRAVTHTHLYKLERRHFESVLESYPFLSMQLARSSDLPPTRAEAATPKNKATLTDSDHIDVNIGGRIHKVLGVRRWAKRRDRLRLFVERFKRLGSEKAYAEMTDGTWVQNLLREVETRTELLNQRATCQGLPRPSIFCGSTSNMVANLPGGAAGSHGEDGLGAAGSGGGAGLAGGAVTAGNRYAQRLPSYRATGFPKKLRSGESLNEAVLAELRAQRAEIAQIRQHLGIADVPAPAARAAGSSGAAGCSGERAPPSYRSGWPGGSSSPDAPSEDSIGSASKGWTSQDLMDIMEGATGGSSANGPSYNGPPTKCKRLPEHTCTTRQEATSPLAPVREGATAREAELFELCEA